MQRVRYCPYCGYSPLTKRTDLGETKYQCPNCEKACDIRSIAADSITSDTN